MAGFFSSSHKCRIRQQSGSKQPRHLWNQKLHDKIITEEANKSKIFHFFMLTWLKQEDGRGKGKASRVNSKQQHFLCFWKERVSWAILSRIVPSKSIFSHLQVHPHCYLRTSQRIKNWKCHRMPSLGLGLCYILSELPLWFENAAPRFEKMGKKRIHDKKQRKSSDLSCWERTWNSHSNELGLRIWW